MCTWRSFIYQHHSNAGQNDKKMQRESIFRIFYSILSSQSLASSQQHTLNINSFVVNVHHIEVFYFHNVRFQAQFDNLSPNSLAFLIIFDSHSQQWIVGHTKECTASDLMLKIRKTKFRYLECELCLRVRLRVSSSNLRIRDIISTCFQDFFIVIRDVKQSWLLDHSYCILDPVVFGF